MYIRTMILPAQIKQASCLDFLAGPGKVFQPFNGIPGREYPFPFLVCAGNKAQNPVDIKPVAVRHRKPFFSGRFRGQTEIQADDYCGIPRHDASGLTENFFYSFGWDYIQQVGTEKSVIGAGTDFFAANPLRCRPGAPAFPHRKVLYINGQPALRRERHLRP